MQQENKLIQIEKCLACQENVLVYIAFIAAGTYWTSLIEKLRFNNDIYIYREREIG